jgi:2-oxoglutarate dehydrogenase E2 component (dihydrolipoamide succinyltransferase)
MAKYQLLLPKMGESVAEATIIKWNKKPGDYIEADEAVMEIATDKVDSEVPSPVSGKLIEQLCKEDDVVQVGSVIAIIETDDAAANEPMQAAPSSISEVKSEPAYQPSVPQLQATAAEQISVSFEQIPGLRQMQQSDLPPSGVKYENRFYSPLVKNIAVQEGIGNDELDHIPGTGSEGRLTKDDLLEYIQKRTSKPVTVQSYTALQTEAPKPVAPPVMAPAAQQPAAQTYTAPQQPVAQAYTPPPAPQPTATPDTSPVTPLAPIIQPEDYKAPVSEAPKPTASVSGGDEIIEMDRMRKLIAEHMVYSKHTSPHVTSFVEADVTNLVQWRDRVKNSFEKREGEKITFTPLFIEAVVKAIKELPMINVSVKGTQIIKKRDINISMATALPSGNLIVPVIKKADQLSLLGITKAVNDLANRARNNKLQPDDVQDGTFTITNVGSFGNVMGTPIINQPQVAILAVGAIKKKVAVIETPEGDTIGIRHMMFLSLSYDHRVVDGALGGTFVRKVADYLENWDISRNI